MTGVVVGHRLVRFLAAAVVLMVCAGCVAKPQGSAPPPVPSGAGLGRNAGTPSAQQAGETVRRALADVERYWTGTFAKVSGGAPFTPLRGGFHAYTRSIPPPACGPEPAEYQPNAFYCPAGDFIAWDAEVLIPQLHADYGALLVAVVVAHEYGHAVQARLGLADQPAIVLEQQADCFAGGWLGDVNAGNSTSFDEPRPDQLDSTLAGMLSLRDRPGVSARAPQAHGNAFDRIRALQDGVEQGPSRCAAYRAGNIPVTEVPFTSAQEAASGGDLPYEEAVSALADSAQAYWAGAFPRLTGRAWEPLRVVPFDPARPPACPERQLSAGDAAGAAFFCPSGGFVAFDSRQLGPALHQRIGDNAVGMLLAGLFAQAVQHRRGQPVQGRAAQLSMDCLAGSWTFELLRGGAGAGIRLSPGDLDEAVATLLVLGRAADSGQAGAFDRIQAYREGTLQGLQQCAHPR